MVTSQALPLLAALAIAAAPSFCSIAGAADAPLAATTLQKSSPKTVRQPAAPSQTALDLRTPPIENVMTQAQIAEVLARTFAPRHIEEVEVDSSRVYDTDGDDYIPPGFASLFWASGHPSGLMRLFMPQQTRPARVIVDATRQVGPPPAIPAMAGETLHYDR